MNTLARPGLAVVLLPLGLLLSVACNRDNTPGTGIIVEVSSDLLVPRDIDQVQLTATDPQGNQLYLNTFDLGDGPNRFRLPIRTGLYPLHDTTTPIHIVAVGQLSAVGQPVASRSATLSFAQGKKVVLELPLLAVCKGVTCKEVSLTCQANGHCESDTVDSKSLPAYVPNQPVPAPDAATVPLDAQPSVLPIDAAVETIADTATADRASDLAPEVAGGGDAFFATGGADAPSDAGGAIGTDGGPTVVDARSETVDTSGVDGPADVPVGGSGGTGGTTATGGITASGGKTSAGGTTTSGGITATGGSVGGIPTSGGTTASGGTVASGGITGSGGATVLGGSPASGGVTSTGGTTSTGGATSVGGTTSLGGTTSTGGTPSVGGNPVGTGDTIPAGYPAPTATNYAVCQSASPVSGGSGSYCPGGGVGPACTECLFGGSAYNNTMTPTTDATSEAGNYAVTVSVGGAATDTSIYIGAESNRNLLALTTIPAGKTLEYAFVVNVRALEGQPEEGGAAGGYPGLDLFFSGPGPNSPPVTGIGYALVTTDTKPVMVYMASDSTECDQTSSIYGGWGQMFPAYFHVPVAIANYGNSGESSSSFYGKADMWGAIKAQWVPGDWAIVQFGHNDKTDTDATVQANLTKYVNDAQAAQVNIILVSPPARLTSFPLAADSQTGDANGVGGLHAASAQAAAAAANPPVPFIDLTALSITWYNTLASKTAALQYHADHLDETHTDMEGGYELAGLVAKAIKDQNIGLAQYLR